MNSSFASITVESGISQQYIPFVPTLLWYKLAGNSSSIRKGPLPYYRSIYTSATSGQVSYTEQDIIFVFTNESTIPWETTYHGLPIKKLEQNSVCPRTSQIPSITHDGYYHDVIKQQVNILINYESDYPIITTSITLQNTKQWWLS